MKKALRGYSNTARWL